MAEYILGYDHNDTYPTLEEATAKACENASRHGSNYRIAKVVRKITTPEYQFTIKDLEVEDA
jgi:hypothetical protein